MTLENRPTPKIEVDQKSKSDQRVKRHAALMHDFMVADPKVKAKLRKQYPGVNFDKRPTPISQEKYEYELAKEYAEEFHVKDVPPDPKLNLAVDEDEEGVFEEIEEPVRLTVGKVVFENKDARVKKLANEDVLEARRLAQKRTGGNQKIKVTLPERGKLIPNSENGKVTAASYEIDKSRSNAFANEMNTQIKIRDTERKHSRIKRQRELNEAEYADLFPENDDGKELEDASIKQLIKKSGSNDYIEYTGAKNVERQENENAFEGSSFSIYKANIKAPNKSSTEKATRVDRNVQLLALLNEQLMDAETSSSRTDIKLIQDEIEKVRQRILADEKKTQTIKKIEKAAEERARLNSKKPEKQIAEVKKPGFFAKAKKFLTGRESTTNKQIQNPEKEVEIKRETKNINEKPSRENIKIVKKVNPSPSVEQIKNESPKEKTPAQKILSKDKENKLKGLLDDLGI